MKGIKFGKEGIFEWIKQYHSPEIEFAKRRITRAINEYKKEANEIWRKYKKECEYCTDEDIATDESLQSELWELQSKIIEKYKLDNLEHEDTDIIARKLTTHFIITGYTQASIDDDIDFEVELDDEMIFLIGLIERVCKEASQ